MKKTSVILMVITAFAGVSCTPSCPNYVSSEGRVVNIKAIAVTLLKKVDANIGEINIDPKFREASEKLKELDLMQSVACREINKLPDGREKNEKRHKYIDVLLEMMQISQSPSATNIILPDTPKVSQDNPCHTVPCETPVLLSDLPKLTGDDASGERIAVPKKNIAGELAFGPYWAVTRFGGTGKYIVEYEIYVDPSSATDPTVGRLRVDVNTPDLKQGIMLAEMILSPVEWSQAGYRIIKLYVDLPNSYANWLVQTRMQWNGKYLTKLRPITVKLIKK